MMRRILLIAAVHIAAPLGAQSRPTDNVLGRVRSVTGAPIAEASVTAEGTVLRARTALDGSFRVDSVPPGIYTVRAVAIGYAPAVRTDGTEGTGRPAEVSLLMRERPLELAELAVTAEPYFQPAAGMPPGSGSLGPNK